MTLKNNVMNQNPNYKKKIIPFHQQKELVSFSLTDKLEGVVLEEG